MTAPFDPRNDLERRLLAAQEGEIPGETFMRELLDAHVFMPVQDEAPIRNLQRSTRAVPLTLEGEDGALTLVLFTSPDRARPFLQDFPGFTGGVLEKFSWVLEKVGVGHAIALNPGCEVGLDIEPDMVDALRKGHDA